MNVSRETIKKLNEKRNALQRIEALEAAIYGDDKGPGLIEASNKSFESANRGFGAMNTTLSRLDELIEALVLIATPEKIEQTVKESRLTKYNQRVALEKQQIDGALLAGSMKSSDTISENSLVVFEETKSDGSPLDVGSRVQYSVSNLVPQFREQLVGKGVGATIVSDPPDAHIFTVSEIYDVVPVTVPASTEAVQ